MPSTLWAILLAYGQLSLHYNVLSPITYQIWKMKPLESARF